MENKLLTLLLFFACLFHLYLIRNHICMLSLNVAWDYNFSPIP